MPYCRPSNVSVLHTTAFIAARWGLQWSHQDVQHICVGLKCTGDLLITGIIWLCAGPLGLLLSFRYGRAQAHFVPAAIFILTGWILRTHAQSLEYSRSVHVACGNTLMASGFARIVYMAIVKEDASNRFNVDAFRYLPPFVS